MSPAGRKSDEQKLDLRLAQLWDNGFSPWVRLSRQRGLPRILVQLVLDQAGEPQLARVPAHLDLIQCATTDGIPFAMKRNELLARYAPL